MRHWKLAAGAAAVAALLLGAGPASAEVRSGSVDDPRDAAGTDPDVRRVTASYDTDRGRLELRLQLYAALDHEATGYLVLNVGSTCADSDFTTDNHFGDAYYGDAKLGEQIVIATVDYGSAVRNEWVWTYQHDALKGHDWRCASRIHTVMHRSDGTVRDGVADLALTAAPSGSVAGSVPPPTAPVVTTSAPPRVDTVPAVRPALATRLGIRSATLGRYARVGVACPASARGRLRIRSRRGVIARGFRCLAGQAVLVRARLPRRLGRARLTVSVGEERVSRVVRAG